MVFIIIKRISESGNYLDFFGNGYSIYLFFKKVKLYFLFFILLKVSMEGIDVTKLIGIFSIGNIGIYLMVMVLSFFSFLEINNLKY